VACSAAWADAAAAEGSFAMKCAGCHMGGGNVVAAGATLFPADLQRNGVGDAESLYKIIYSGKGKMPGFGQDCAPKVSCLRAGGALCGPAVRWLCPGGAPRCNRSRALRRQRPPPAPAPAPGASTWRHPTAARALRCADVILRICGCRASARLGRG
jgi:hypothetical protein